MTTIKSVTGEVLYVSGKPTLEEAVKQEVNLHKANLHGANLQVRTSPTQNLQEQTSKVQTL